MPALDISTLVAGLAPPLDAQLTEQFLNEFISLERRYVLHDWEPATLDGGQFAEVAARILYHQDSGLLDVHRGFARCLSYLEDQTKEHLYPDQRSLRHQARLLRVIYKFRSDRGAVHIDVVHTANQLDSRLVLEGARWLVSEVLRVSWASDRRTVVNAIRDITHFEVPAIGRFEDRLIVQRTDLLAEEEILLLLYDAGDAGLSRREIGRFVLRAPSTISDCLRKITSASRREVVKLSSGKYRLSDVGTRRVVKELGTRLVS